MNYIKNDRGEMVMAIGSPGSEKRAQVEFPALIEKLNMLYMESYDAPGRAIDQAIQVVRDAGITGEMETISIIRNTLYALEPSGSVAKLVLGI